MPESSVITLAIETSNPGSATSAPGPVSGPGVALGRSDTSEKNILLGVEFLQLGRSDGSPFRGGHDDDLMPAIDRLCKRVGVTPKAIGRVAVSIGPGGYTGLRIACAVGKMIAEVAGAKCVAVPTARVVLARAAGRGKPGPVAIALAGKKDSAWVEVYADSPPRAAAASVAVVRAGQLVTAADVPTLFEDGVRTIVGDHFLPAPIREAALSLGIEIIEPIFDPAACLEVAAALPDIDPVELVPLYPREPDAVTLWRARKAGGVRSPLPEGGG